jgi:hypothetical protein
MFEAMFFSPCFVYWTVAEEPRPMSATFDGFDVLAVG